MEHSNGHQLLHHISTRRPEANVILNLIMRQSLRAQGLRAPGRRSATKLLFPNRLSIALKRLGVTPKQYVNHFLHESLDRHAARSLVAGAKSSTAGDVTAGVGTWDDGEGEIGPAFKATLEMLDWSKLCDQVARFASTHAGKRACRTMSVPEEPAETLRLIEQTR